MVPVGARSKTGSGGEARTSWREALAVYAHRRVVGMGFLGFSAGLPYALPFATLSFWLREAGIERDAIGLLSLAGLSYSLKWTWAPLVDRLPLPWLGARLGRRRSWILVAQLAIVAALACMAFTDPASDLPRLIAAAIAVSFASATQDIAIDAYRIEAVEEDRQAAMAATYMAGYRIGMIAASAGVLVVAAATDLSEGTYEQRPWTVAYLAMALLMLVGVATTLIIAEPEVERDAATLQREARAVAALRRRGGLLALFSGAGGWLYGAAVLPLLDFLSRYRWQAVLVLALVGTYRISDVVLGTMANVFYVDLGFSKAEVATISKLYGVGMTLAGAGLGGVLIRRYGIMRLLFVGGLLAAATNLLFAGLAGRGADTVALTAVISLDNLSTGIASAAFVAYLSSLTNVEFSATQYAMFSSLMSLVPKLMGGFSGYLVDALGWRGFFVGTALLGAPVLVLILLAARYAPARHPSLSDEP